MDRKVFLIDNNNKKIKWLSTAWLRIGLIPIVDVIVLLGVVSGILFYLNYSGVVSLYLGGTSFITYIFIVLAYISINVLIAIFDFIKFKSFNNTMVVKENDNITIVKFLKTYMDDSIILVNKDNVSVLPKTKDNGDFLDVTIGSIFYNNSKSLLSNLLSLGIYVGGTLEMQKDLTENDIKKLAEVNISKILDERNKSYKYDDYKNCKLVNETKNYYEYVGEKDGVSSKFKIHKVYSNINLLNKEEN